MANVTLKDFIRKYDVSIPIHGMWMKNGLAERLSNKEIVQISLNGNNAVLKVLQPGDYLKTAVLCQAAHKGLQEMAQVLVRRGKLSEKTPCTLSFYGKNPGQVRDSIRHLVRLFDPSKLVFLPTLESEPKTPSFIFKMNPLELRKHLETLFIQEPKTIKDVIKTFSAEYKDKNILGIIVETALKFHKSICLKDRSVIVGLMRELMENAEAAAFLVNSAFDLMVKLQPANISDHVAFILNDPALFYAWPLAIEAATSNIYHVKQSNESNIIQLLEAMQKAVDMVEDADDPQDIKGRIDKFLSLIDDPIDVSRAKAFQSKYGVKLTHDPLETPFTEDQIYYIGEMLNKLQEMIRQGKKPEVPFIEISKTWSPDSGMKSLMDNTRGILHLSIYKNKEGSEVLNEKKILTVMIHDLGHEMFHYLSEHLTMPDGRKFFSWNNDLAALARIGDFVLITSDHKIIDSPGEIQNEYISILNRKIDPNAPLMPLHCWGRKKNSNVVVRDKPDNFTLPYGVKEEIGPYWTKAPVEMLAEAGSVYFIESSDAFKNMFHFPSLEHIPIMDILHFIREHMTFESNGVRYRIEFRKDKIEMVKA